MAPKSEFKILPFLIADINISYISIFLQFFFQESWSMGEYAWLSLPFRNPRARVLVLLRDHPRNGRYLPSPSLGNEQEAGAPESALSVELRVFDISSFVFFFLVGYAVQCKPLK
jgi:hypothetical protein